ncbi:MAG: hypothetical protein Q9216_000887 [Gyalolechia sp. 2 TL-2023]
MKALRHSKVFSASPASLETSTSVPLHANDFGVIDMASRGGDQDQSPDDSPGSSNQVSMRDDKNGNLVSSKKKLHRVASKTEKVIRRLVNAPNQEMKVQDTSPDSGQFLTVLEDDAAFNVDQLNTKHRSEKDVAAKTQVNLRAVAAGIMHPKQGIKGKATRSTAGRLSRMERPYLSKTMDIEFLEAHDHLSRAQSLASSTRNTSEEESNFSGDDCKERVEQLEAQRESLRAAYTTSRLVHRVRVVPKRHINFPGRERFEVRNNQGKEIAYDWLRWIGYNLLFYTQDFSAQYIDDFDELPFDIDSVRQQLERLAVASAPWQAFFMDLRSVYCWDDPLITTKWLALYVFLWYTQHLVGFIAMRESIRRSHDQRSGAYKFGELVDKHGRHHWIEPLLDELGPYVQLQLNDLANILEVFANFHAWMYPRKTAATLVFLSIATFIIGGAFFFCWPIASKYPKYRYLVSPFKWALWDIPTDAEWSFQYLRRHAQMEREQLVKRRVDRIHQDENDGSSPISYVVPDITVNEGSSHDEDDWHSACSTTSVLGGLDIVAYRAYSQGVVGRLIIYSSGIRFVRSVKRRELWRRSYLELVEMRKKEGSSVSRIPGVPSQSLELKFLDGSKLGLKGMKDRDSAFNTIIGFSGLQWQSLQAKTMKENTDDSAIPGF